MWLLTTLTAGLFVWYLLSVEIGAYSLGCGKSGELEPHEGLSDSATCQTAAVDALDTSVTVSMVAVLLGPAAAATIVNRVWVSMLAIVALIPPTVVGLMNWPTYWSLLFVGGVPIAVGSVLAACIHLAHQSYLQRRARRGADSHPADSLFDAHGRNRLFTEW